MIYKICQRCGKTFTTKYTQSKYCCSDCKEAVRKEQRKEWDKKHPGYITNYMKKYRKETKRTKF